MARALVRAVEVDWERLQEAMGLQATVPSRGTVLGAAHPGAAHSFPGQNAATDILVQALELEAKKRHVTVHTRGRGGPPGRGEGTAAGSSGSRACC